MLTLKQIRDDKEAAVRKLAKKGVDAAPVIAKIEMLDDRRKAMQAWADYIDQLKSDDKKVTPINKDKAA